MGHRQIGVGGMGEVYRTTDTKLNLDLAVEINYDVSPDGASFMMVDPGNEDRAAARIDVLLNWHEELKRLVPVE